MRILALQTNTFTEPPAIGTEVIFIAGKKIRHGTIDYNKSGTWGVRVLRKIHFPYLSDLIRVGSVVKEVESSINIID